MQTSIDIKEDQMVHLKGAGAQASEGVHVGTVDHMDGDFIKLKRSSSPDGQHHWIPLSWVQDVEGNIVIVNKSEADFKKGLLSAKPKLS